MPGIALAADPADPFVQEQFFAGHRIAGTETYSVKHGESLWVIAQQHGSCRSGWLRSTTPTWISMMFGRGTSITLPRVVAINRQ